MTMKEEIDARAAHDARKGRNALNNAFCGVLGASWAFRKRLLGRPIQAEEVYGLKLLDELEIAQRALVSCPDELAAYDLLLATTALVRYHEKRRELTKMFEAGCAQGEAGK